MNIRSIVKKLVPTALFMKVEPLGHLVEAVLANVHYGFPGRKLRVIGVTGTNGKTTTSFMIHRMLHEAGINVALSTTVGYGIGDDITSQVAHITTAQAGILQKRLRSYADAGVEWVVVETSSHALAQHRVWGVPYEIGVLTNITHDHLDYHKTFERYVEAKRQLFVLANRRGLKTGIVNAQDASSPLFEKSIAHSVSYGIGTGDVRAEDVQLTSNGSTFTAKAGDDEYHIEVAIPGEFNVSNALAAISVGRTLGLSVEQIEKGIAALKFVEGRMNVIDEGQAFKVIVDFASTPDGFEKLLSSLRPLVKGRLVAVFGSAGRRDASKRRLQGDIAARYCDVIIATEEDDRDEDGDAILEEIAAGAEAQGKIRDETLYLVHRREEAIKKSFTLVSGADDTVVLLGKGHEKTIERADGVYDWNESEVARAALRELRQG